MKNRTLSLCAPFFSAALLLWVAALPLAARTHQSDKWADSQYEKATALRDNLEKQPEKQRTHAQYQRVIDAFRKVYYGAPTSGKADPSVAAVADVMVEMGHQFHDEKILRSAIKQYEFLRKEYPGSRSRFSALLTIGQIYKNDLNDPESATDTFREFLRHYPHHELAAAAKMALAEPVVAAKKSDKAKLAEKSQKATADISPQTTPGITKAEATQDEASQGSATPGNASEDSPLATVTRVHYQTTPDSATVFIDLTGDVKYDVERLSDPDRIYFDLFDSKLREGLNGSSIAVHSDLLKQVRIGIFQPRKIRVVLDVSPETGFQVSTAQDPARLKIELVAKNADAAVQTPVKSESRSGAAAPAESGKKAPVRRIVDTDADEYAASKTPPGKKHEQQNTAAARTSSHHGKRRSARTIEPDVHEALPTAAGDRSLIRALGLKIGKIVIDPGHGGHDTGTIGPHGLLEKDLVLDVSKRLDKLLENRLGAEVAMTRDDDTFIPLEQRTAIANEEHADLFISVHANSSHDPDARGIETYYLNFTSSSDALEVAARENAMSNDSIYQLQDLIKTIALKEKIEESREFASDVQEALHDGLARRNPGLRDRGVKKAPFIVLIGAHMPSILAEISFVSNPGDERRLRSPAYRQRIAESLYQGIAKYVSGLSGVKVASKVDKSEGQ